MTGLFARRRLIAVVILAAIAIASWVAVVWVRKSFNPLALNRFDAYLFAPHLFRYCFVPLGTPERAIRTEFSSPAVVLVDSDGSFTDHVQMRQMHGWTVPPKAFTDRILVYIDYDGGINQVEAYYFMNENGRLARTYISEGP